MATIGERILELRTAAGISQAKLAELAHTDKSQISRYEQGRIQPSMTSLYRLAVAFGLDVNDLVKGTK